MTQIEPSIDYERELKIATNKLHYHEDQIAYHKAQAAAMRERIEEVEPLTNAWEREKQRAAENTRNSKEFQEIRKKVKKKRALTMVDIMLQRIQDTWEQDEKGGKL